MAIASNRGRTLKRADRAIRYAPTGATLSNRGTVRMPAKSLAAAPVVNAKPLRGGFATLASIDYGTHGLLLFGMQGMWSAPLRTSN
jgi:hypothetical protein